MNNVLKPFLDKLMVIYLDDIMVLNENMKEHKKLLAKVFEALRQKLARENHENPRATLQQARITTSKSFLTSCKMPSLLFHLNKYNIIFITKP